MTFDLVEIQFVEYCFWAFILKMQIQRLVFVACIMISSHANVLGIAYMSPRMMCDNWLLSEHQRLIYRICVAHHFPIIVL